MSGTQSPQCADVFGSLEDIPEHDGFADPVAGIDIPFIYSCDPQGTTGLIPATINTIGATACKCPALGQELNGNGVCAPIQCPEGQKLFVDILYGHYAGCFDAEIVDIVEDCRAKDWDVGVIREAVDVVGLYCNIRFVRHFITSNGGPNLGNSCIINPPEDSTARNKCRDLFGNPPQFPPATGDSTEDNKRYVAHCNVEETIPGAIPATINLTGAKECSCDSAAGFVGEYPNCACPTGGSVNANGVCACASGSVAHGETCIPEEGDFGELSDEILCEAFGGDVLQQSFPQEAENLADELLTLAAFHGTSAEAATVLSAMVDAIQAKWGGDIETVNTFLSRYDTGGADYVQSAYYSIIIHANHDAYGVGTFDQNADNQLAEILARVPVDLSGKICSGMDANDTFCIIGSDEGFPCRGLFKHLRSCNVDFNRKALNPFFCGEKCGGMEAFGSGCR